MSDPVNASPDTRFDEATPDQFREFWEGQGWKVSLAPKPNLAFRKPNRGPCIRVCAYFQEPAYISLGFNEDDTEIEFDELIGTFGEALRYANNLAQAELFGGWAE